MDMKAIIGGERKKLLLQIISIILLVFLLLVFGDTARKWWGMRQADRAAEALKQFEAEATARMMADTVGGKTPQETLQMYIEAVEGGDFELASKYFVEAKREGEKNNLVQTQENKNTEFLLGLLRQIVDVEGYYSTDKKRYTVEDPAFADFVLYPNGIWKIVEI